MESPSSQARAMVPAEAAWPAALTAHSSLGGTSGRPRPVPLVGGGAAPPLQAEHTHTNSRRALLLRSQGERSEQRPGAESPDTHRGAGGPLVARSPQPPGQYSLQGRTPIERQGHPLQDWAHQTDWEPRASGLPSTHPTSSQGKEWPSRHSQPAHAAKTLVSKAPGAGAGGPAGAAPSPRPG